MTFPSPFDPNGRHRALWYWCALACRAAYDLDDAKRRAIFNWPGPAEISFESEPDITSPDWIYGEYEDACVVAVRGTDSAQEAWEDIRGALGFRDSIHYPGLVHAFFGLAAEGIYQRLHILLESAPNPNRIIFTGHSLGAAVALVLSAMYQQSREVDPLAVVTFGCPRVGNGTFADACTWPVFRIENFADPITFVPPPGIGNFRGPLATGIGWFRFWSHVGKAWVFDNAGAEVEIPFVTTIPAMPANAPIPTDTIVTQYGPSHQLGCYIQRMRANTRSGGQAATGWPLYGPLHVTAAAVMQADGWQWPFEPEPARGGPATPPSYVPPALATAMKSVCHGPCCRAVDA